MRRTSVIKSTVLRISASLIERNHLLKDPQSDYRQSDYRLGPEIARLNLVYS